MVPCSFDESNHVLGAPRSMAHDECEPLSVCLAKQSNSGQDVVISCWKFTPEELEQVQKTGRIWLGVFGETMPPVWLTGVSPFDKSIGG